MGVNARLLSHKNGRAGLLVVVRKVKVKMAGTVDYSVLTLIVLRQVAYVHRAVDWALLYRAADVTTALGATIIRPFPMKLLRN